MAPHFSRKFIKAINDWQIGSKGKEKKAQTIQKLLTDEPVDQWIQECDNVCFRKVNLQKTAVSSLFLDFRLTEAKSSWSTSLPFVAEFGGGPPEPPIVGAIFRHKPQKMEVILNLNRLFKHEAFWPSVEHWRNGGLDVSRGLGSYGTRQYEVILTVDQIPHEEIYAFGSNSAQGILDATTNGMTLLGATPLTIEEITAAFAAAADLQTKRWLTGELAERVYLNWLAKIVARPDLDRVIAQVLALRAARGS